MPDLPETGYGYIRRGEYLRASRIRWPLKWRSLSKNQSGNRPGLCGKRRILLEQRHFLFRAGRYLEELKKYRPDILTPVKKR